MTNQYYVLLSACLGSCLEVYDFVLFLSFIDIIIKEFTPPGIDGFATLMFVNYVARPLGGVFFGLVGDRRGRKDAVMWVMFLMSLPSITIASLPSYADWGYTSFIILCCMRALQGFCLSGEIFTSFTLLMDDSYSRGDKSISRGWITGFFTSALWLGAMLARFLNTIMLQMQLEEYWRYFFVSGSLIAIIGFWVRKNISSYRVSNELSNSTIFFNIFSRHKLLLLLVMFASGNELSNATSLWFNIPYYCYSQELRADYDFAVLVCQACIIPFLSIAGYIAYCLQAFRFVYPASCFLFFVNSMNHYLTWYSVTYNTLWSVYLGAFLHNLGIVVYWPITYFFIYRVIPSNLKCTLAGLGFGLAGLFIASPIAKIYASLANLGIIYPLFFHFVFFIIWSLIINQYMYSIKDNKEFQAMMNS